MYPIIDILRLHHPDDTEKSAIRAFGGEKLNKFFDELSTKFCQDNKTSYAQLAKLLEVNKNSIQNWRGFSKKYQNGHPIPIWVLDKLLQLTNQKYREKHKQIIESIKALQCGRVSKPVKAVIYLKPKIARLCGAHAADGSLYGEKNKGPLTARWDIGDFEIANIMAAQNWIKKLFGINLKILKKGNMSYIWTNMQILSRYLVQIFGFPIGPKTQTVREPIIFLKNDNRLLTSLSEDLRWKLRFEFAREVLNFDGHSTKTGGIPSIGLGCKSPDLRESVVETFQHFGVIFKDYKKHEKLLTTSKKEAKKIYDLNVFRGNKKKKLRKLIGS